MLNRRLMSIFAIITSFGAYIMLLLGAAVTRTDSGQGCGNSWPFCHGQLIPESLPIATVYEYSHRIMSGADSFLIFALALWAWLAYRRDFRIKLFGVMSLFFVVLQAILGALTVVYEGTYAKEGLLSLHFGFSLISFASVILLTMRIMQLQRLDPTQPERTAQQVAPVSKWIQIVVWCLAAYTYVVVYTGALVGHASATLACGQQFPTCGSTYVPSFMTSPGIQVLHRYSAASIWFLLLALMVVMIRLARDRRDLIWGSLWAFVLVSLQALSGMATVLSGAQLLVALLHTTIISVLFSVICYLCVQVEWPWRRQPVERSSVVSLNNAEKYQHETV
ncbi:COX15/CtaA family protein [Dictyobacter kobayashii]|uniref:Heme A synthase n=1 Tax=Dictyobacter kobayashii TaxID=2014872 RepID=A0A402ATT2_9CHLR|nr:heme A synthase [Dictyobacter kobayashii]GCE22494.1 heme A synthase [Dictyobacter kobayashii]